MSYDFRLPAEWEPQAAILLAWPHSQTDWNEHLEEVENTYLHLIEAITRFELVMLFVANDKVQAHAEHLLKSAGIPSHKVQMIYAEYDDTWLRDSGPITLVSKDSFRLNDFHFTGWGGKFSASHDDLLVECLYNQGIFQHAEHRRIDWALEGGAIESDGSGTILTTWQCLHQRHPQYSRDDFTHFLREHLNADQVLILNHGYLQGDDTDAHIDTLSRFAPNDTIVFQTCDNPDDEHYAELQRMAEEISKLRTNKGKNYRLYPLPWPRPIYYQNRRLAASYANYLVINNAVLVPAYDDPADEKAVAVMKQIYPEREIISIPCRPLIWQNGSLHCLTMQLPKGILA